MYQELGVLLLRGRAEAKFSNRLLMHSLQIDDITDQGNQKEEK